MRFYVRINSVEFMHRYGLFTRCLQSTGTILYPQTRDRPVFAVGETTNRFNPETCASSSVTPAGGGFMEGAAVSFRRHLAEGET